MKAVCAAHNISAATYHAWKRKYGGKVQGARRLRALEEENVRLKWIIADLSVQNRTLKKVNAKNGEPVCKTAGRKNESGKRMEQWGAGVPGAVARAVELLPGWAGEGGKPAHPQGGLGTEREASTLRVPADYGTAEAGRLRSQRQADLARIRREEGLRVSKKQRRMKRVGLSTSERRRATWPREVWSWDFAADQTVNGSNFRILTLLDERTRECLATHAAWSIRAVDVITVLKAAIARYGSPEHIRSDSGQEFIS